MFGNISIIILTCFLAHVLCA